MKYIYWIVVLAVFGVSGQFFGTEVITLAQKTVFVILVLSASVFYGLSASRIRPFVLFCVVFIFSTVGATLSDSGEIDLPLAIKSFLSLSAVFLLFAVRLPFKQMLRIESAFVVLPFLSVAAGFFFSVVLGLSPWMSEFTGVNRLRGASIPPHLAMMSVVAIYFFQIRFLSGRSISKIDWILLVGNLAIILLTGTRGALIVVGIGLFPLLARFLKGRQSVLKIAALLPFLAVFAFVAAQNFAARNEGTIVEGEQDFSGRMGAWIFFYERYEQRPIFGYGLGAVTEMTKGHVDEYLQAFVVPHNEYLRFMVDFGVIGTLSLFLGLLVMFGQLTRRFTSGRYRAGVVWIFVSAAVFSVFDNPIGTLCYSVPFCLLLNASYGAYREIS